MSDNPKDIGGYISESEEKMQLDAEIQTLQEKSDEIRFQMEIWENELTILKEKKELLDDMEEIQRIDDRIFDIEQQIDRWEGERDELLEERDKLISEKKSSDLLTKLERLEGGTTVVDDLKSIAKDAAKKVAAAPVTMAVQAVKGGVRSAISKANPFDKQINKNDVTDSGVESIRLAYTSVKKAKNSIKTVSQTVKTTNRTIKTAGNAAKTTVKIAYKTPIYIVKTAVKAVRVTGTIAANVVAAAMNPIVIAAMAILLLFLMCASLVVLLLGGAENIDAANEKASTGAIGLVEVPKQYQDAVNFFNIAVQSRQDAFNALIDGLYYNYDDLTHSNLVYMEKTDASGGKTTYQTSFATDERKDTLKSAWDFSADDVRGIIAVAYVYLEKQENEAHGTEGGIYEVTYTQEVFDMLAEKCVNFNDSIYSGQDCGTGCTRHVEIVDNPAYPAAWNAVNTAASAYNEWAEVAALIAANSTIRDGNAQVNHWNNMVLPLFNGWIIKYNRYPTTTNNGYDFLSVLGSEYEAASWELDNTPPTIEKVTYICEYQHELHSIGLWYYNKDSIMDALGFTDNEKEWVSLTEMGFENNPNIP